MHQNNDASHETNVNHFEALILICENLGARYNPPSEYLKTTKLRLQLTDCKEAINAVSTAKEAFSLATRTRKEAVNNLLPLATRVTGNFVACDVTQAAITHIKAINKKIQKGIEHHSESTTTTEEETTSRASQQSIDYRVAHWETLIDALKLEPNYLPNEPVLKLDSLQDMMEDVHAMNTSVTSLDLTCTAKQIARDKALYEENIGLCDIAQRVKNYLKSTLGAASTEYKAANKLRFRTRDFAESVASTIATS